MGNVLTQLPQFYSLLFVFLMFYSIFAFMNIITGTMVESILSAATSDRSITVRTEKMSKSKFLHDMSQVFSAVDTDRSRCLSLEELKKHMEDPDVCAYFAALGLETHQVSNLFLLL